MPWLILIYLPMLYIFIAICNFKIILCFLLQIEREDLTVRNDAKKIVYLRIGSMRRWVLVAKNFFEFFPLFFTFFYNFLQTTENYRMNIDVLLRIIPKRKEERCSKRIILRNFYFESYRARSGIAVEENGLASLVCILLHCELVM